MSDSLTPPPPPPPPPPVCVPVCVSDDDEYDVPDHFGILDDPDPAFMRDYISRLDSNKKDDFTRAFHFDRISSIPVAVVSTGECPELHESLVERFSQLTPDTSSLGAAAEAEGYMDKTGSKERPRLEIVAQVWCINAVDEPTEVMSLGEWAGGI